MVQQQAAGPPGAADRGPRRRRPPPPERQAVSPESSAQAIRDRALQARSDAARREQVDAALPGQSIPEPGGKGAHVSPPRGASTGDRTAVAPPYPAGRTMRPSPEFEAGALWLTRLDPAHEFGAPERAMVLSVFFSIDVFAARTEVRGGGQPRGDPFLVVEGLVGCSRRTASGRRQMIAILVPGDLYAGEEAINPPSSLSVHCLSDCRIAFLPHPLLEELGLTSPKLRRALRRLEQEQRRTVQEWVLNLGGRSAATRLANLFCELFERLARVGLVRDCAYELPLTQQDLA